MMTKCGVDISRNIVGAGIYGLVNRFYKILPMKEEGCPTLNEYMESFLRELVGMGALIPDVGSDSSFTELVSTLQYMIDYPCDVNVVRTEVFKSIAVVKRMAERYGGDHHE